LQEHRANGLWQVELGFLPPIFHAIFFIVEIFHLAHFFLWFLSDFSSIAGPGFSSGFLFTYVVLNMSMNK
jgi:hypothetical protein